MRQIYRFESKTHRVKQIMTALRPRCLDGARLYVAATGSLLV
jgi:hypothetical protein